MFPRILMLSVLFLTSNFTALCQSTTRQSKVDSPANVALLLASQPGCPLRLDDTRFVQSEGGANWGAQYIVNNVGSKPIRSFSIMIVSSFGTGGTLDHFDGEKSGMLLPGQTINPRDNKAPLYKPGPRGKSSASTAAVSTIAVLIVGKIVFADGSIYDGERVYKELQDYFAEVDLKITR